MTSNRTSSVLALALAAAVLPRMATAQPLKRDLASYFLFAQKNVQAKDIRVDSACNIGVNCAKPNANANCGVAGFEKMFMADGGQLAADEVNFSTAGASVWQLFTNKPFIAGNVEVRKPPVSTFTLPIIPGTCGPNCTPDAAALAVACGFPSPFPSCDPTNNVFALPGVDCIPPSADSNLGNGRCNLPPGTYGDIIVKDNADLDMTTGDYNVCSILVGKTAHVTGAASVVNIQGTSPTALRVSNQSTFGGKCGDFKVFIQGNSDVQFGKSSTIAAQLCAPEASIGLGHLNTLIGQFIGDDINANRGNKGQCCIPDGKCTCIDTFTPSSAKVGDIVTLNSGCDLNNTTLVKICGVTAPIQTKNVNVLTAKVGVGTPLGNCNVEVVSATGTFKTVATISIVP